MLNIFYSLSDIFANAGMLKFFPVIIVLVGGYFLIKGLEEIFKIIFYIFAIAVLIYFFKDILFSLI